MVLRLRRLDRAYDGGIAVIAWRRAPAQLCRAPAPAISGGAVDHEGQHQLDYPATGYPTDRKSEQATEMNAYRIELGVAKGLGISTDLYASGALQNDVDARVNQAADVSTAAWCANKGC